jgi:hypothetical protein
MSVKLKVLHGALKKHGKWQVVVPVKKSPFVIGQAADCSMRCYGKAISDYHCEIRVEGVEVFVRDLNSKNGTFINGEKLAGELRFFAGDQLHLGRLAFELLVKFPARRRGADDFDEFVSQMLLEADEADRRERKLSPDKRWYQIEPVEPPDPYEGMTPKERLIAKARAKIPPKQDNPKKLPGKLFVAGSINQAVSESLATHYQGLDT